MKRILSYLSFVLMVLTLASCKNGGTWFTPVSSGRPYEMLVIVDKATWERPAGRALFNVLDTDVPGLPQSERSFRISYAPPSEFDQMLRIFRNIILVDINKDVYTQPKLKYSRDVYAEPQMIMRIQAPSEEEFAEYVTKNRQLIIDFFVNAELNRQIKEFDKKHSEIVAHKVDSIFGCKLYVPVELTAYKVGKDFFWASTNTATSDMNVAVYSYPYVDKNTFTREYFIHKRDSVMEKNIPGSREGMYMTTDTLYVESKDISVHGGYAQEVRGLWAMKGDMMGGPFVSHARVDEKNGRVIVVEGFIFSPDKRKRDLVRMMEAALYTLQLPQESKAEEIPMEGAEETEMEKDTDK